MKKKIMFSVKKGDKKDIIMQEVINRYNSLLSNYESMRQTNKILLKRLSMIEDEIIISEMCIRGGAPEKSEYITRNIRRILDGKR